MLDFREFITDLLSDRNTTKSALAKYLDVSPQTLNTILVKGNPRKITIRKMAEFLSIDAFEIEKMIKQIKGLDASEPTETYNTVKYVLSDKNTIELPYVPSACRATFAETYTNQNIMETFTIFAEPGERYDKDIVFEVNGDSMEPYYYDKMKVRARLVDISEWEYINSGVFIVAYRNNLVIKRIKSNELFSAGYLTLHSDNTQLGGSQMIPKKELQRIWKVMRIVDAPVR